MQARVCESICSGELRFDWKLSAERRRFWHVHETRKRFSNGPRAALTRGSSAVCKCVRKWTCFLWSLQRPWKTPNQQRRPFRTPAQRRTFNGRPVKCKIISNRQTALDDEDGLFLCLSSLFWCGNDFLTFGGSFPVQIDRRRTQTSIRPALLRSRSGSSASGAHRMRILPPEKRTFSHAPD